MTLPTPTRYGRHLRDEWLLDTSVTYLNHGTVGAPPRRVLEHQRALQDEIERHPARFLLRELADPHAEGIGRTPRMREAAAAVAGFVGLTPDDELVFVDNITTGANAILRSFPFRPGDELAVTTLGYGGVTNAARYAARVNDVTLNEIALPGPGTASDEFVDLIVGGLGQRARVLVVDHLTASTALILPIADIAAACHARGVLVLADGAHVPGNFALDVTSLGVDWYVANLHKWAWAPRSCGFVWAAPEHRGYLHPAVVSWGLDHGIEAEFDLTGTRDPSPWLTAPFALDLLREFGGDDVFAHNHDLACWAGRFLSDRWGAAYDTPDSMIGAMVAVDLPRVLGDSKDDAEHVYRRLDAAGIEVPVYHRPDGLWTRVSAQIYCDRADIEHLADAVCALAPPRSLR